MIERRRSNPTGSRSSRVLKEWQAQSPKSPVPALLLADAYTSYAWYARGTGKPDTVKKAVEPVQGSPQPGRLLSQREPPHVRRHNPQWHTTALISRAAWNGRATALIRW